ncbi:YhgE/Pip domain-containing protein [Glycomyces terrestris]|uniref:YhgE/Pip domain-containing protein n=1 Tax=Glycomyces terrestris TaxID=2493553 RepID=A0A426USZ0_9ACTN|nr:YhgE/Pip domain-containing protein [Glycomyces terrestris]RRR96773.1 YhgE/Pip domain-containing protein [Glycomyces terrestris]
MLRPFANSTRAGAAGPLTWRTWAGLVLVPVLAMGLLTWALWNPDADHGTATAAVVNNDKPVTVDGQTIPLGRELAGELTHADDSAYTWTLTDAADAESGLADGTYTAVVTIPENFSAQGTSAATATGAGGNPDSATKAVLDIETSNAAGAADPALSKDVALATQRTLDGQVVETYLDNIYVAFNTIHDQLADAADGASQLADGTSELASGATELSTAAGELATGADTLADATAQLETGSADLADGLDEAETAVADLPAATRELADGAEQVAQGNEAIAAEVVPLANDIIAAIDALPSAEDAAADFQDLASQCAAEGANPDFCADLQSAADDFSAEAADIDAAIASVRAKVVETRDAVQALATGARQVADGNDTLADQMPALVSGITEAADGADELATGAAQTNDGAQELASGADQLADGADRLASGAADVDDGAQQLATGLADGRDQVPTYTESERAHLASIAADPSTATVAGAGIGELSIALFAVIALWALALAVYLVTTAVPGDILTSRAPTWRIILQAALPGATAAALAALAITAIAVPVMDLRIDRALAFLGVALLAAFTFTALNQALVAIFGRAGRLASVAVLILTIALGVVSTLPAPLYALVGWIPTRGAVVALRAAALGGPGLATGVTQLAVWLGVGALATILVTDRRRTLSARHLRLSGN